MLVSTMVPAGTLPLFPTYVHVIEDSKAWKEALYKEHSQVTCCNHLSKFLGALHTLIYSHKYTHMYLICIIDRKKSSMVSLLHDKEGDAWTIITF